MVLQILSWCPILGQFNVVHVAIFPKHFYKFSVLHVSLLLYNKALSLAIIYFNISTVLFYPTSILYIFPLTLLLIKLPL